MHAEPPVFSSILRNDARATKGGILAMPEAGGRTPALPRLLWRNRSAKVNCFPVGSLPTSTQEEQEPTEAATVTSLGGGIDKAEALLQSSQQWLAASAAPDASVAGTAGTVGDSSVAAMADVARPGGAREGSPKCLRSDH
eukprot:CAMPEP_0177211454 /NCGR_PEP_ID=MMETSP0367-20130122/32103_1 /TAXON_ID=447022 ORGANISM="Scrippsiella hangoei-like, Strain SHHI-4" /NCGR_SAMPLE_ID=MMETSP0367 /ASSEMBLY_ACC=CAM_ASM_000362 /LENGTH=139 /DNA_ID=CAMNT_0018660645 /DNA_START=339 /DNA_END=755 /DNA_ORIENTATION=-